MQGPWLLAATLELLADGVDDTRAAARLVTAARGSRESLRGAYARALALAGELPDDLVARRAVDLLTRAMRGQFAVLPVDASSESSEAAGEGGNVRLGPGRSVAAGGL